MHSFGKTALVGQKVLITITDLGQEGKTASLTFKKPVPSM
jgi:hypothetical protein